MGVKLDAFNIAISGNIVRCSFKSFEQCINIGQLTSIIARGKMFISGMYS